MAVNIFLLTSLTLLQLPQLSFVADTHEDRRSAKRATKAGKVRTSSSRKQVQSAGQKASRWFCGSCGHVYNRLRFHFERYEVAEVTKVWGGE